MLVEGWVALLAVEATLDVIDEGVDKKLSDYVLVSIYVFMWENKKSCVEWPAGSRNGFKNGLELGVGEFICGSVLLAVLYYCY